MDRDDERPRRLRIAIDALGCGGLATGLGRHMRDLLASWVARHPHHRYEIFALASEEADYRVPDSGGVVRFHSPPPWVGPPATQIAWSWCGFPARAARLAADVCLIATERRLSPLRGPPTAAIVHDLAAFALQDKYPAANRRFNRHVLPPLLRRARQLLAISETTRRDLIVHARVDPRRIRMVRHGVAPIPVSPGPSRILDAAAIGAPTFLYPARIEHPGKNHAVLVEAIRRLRDEGREVHAVCPGAAWTGADRVREAIRRTGLESRVHLPGFVEDRELHALYRSCAGLAFPSRYEGFGLPLVEAMDAGAPIVAAPSPAAIEVAGDAAIYADGDDPGAWARALARLLDDPQLRDRLIARGTARRRRYDPDVCADETLALLTGLVAGRARSSG